jgi:lipoyl(octanoyl) transferase
VRDLEEAIIRTVAAFGIDAQRIDGLTGVWTAAPRKLASIGVHASRWVTTHGYALNVDLDPGPFTDWITACGLEDAQFTTMALELGHSVSVEDARSPAARAIAEVFGLRFDELSVDEITALVGQPVAPQAPAPDLDWTACRRHCPSPSARVARSG